jgi:hypothetical protein
MRGTENRQSNHIPSVPEIHAREPEMRRDQISDVNIKPDLDIKCQQTEAIQLIGSNAEIASDRGHAIHCNAEPNLCEIPARRDWGIRANISQSRGIKMAPNNQTNTKDTQGIETGAPSHSS